MSTIQYHTIVYDNKKKILHRLVVNVRKGPSTAHGIHRNTKLAVLHYCMQLIAHHQSNPISIQRGFAEHATAKARHEY